MKKIQILLVAIVAALSSCTTYTYTSRSISVNRGDANMSANYTDLDIHYDQRITAKSDWHRYRLSAIEEANHRATEANNADVLVDPIYQITFRPFSLYERFSAQVVGYAGYYKVGESDFQHFLNSNVTLEDIEKYHILNNPEMLETYYRYHSENNATSQQNVYNIKCGKDAPAKTQTTEVVKTKKTKATKAKKQTRQQKKGHRTHEIHIF